MQTITDLTLPYLPMDEASFAANPFPHFEKARAEHPWLATCPYGPVVTQLDAMRDLLYLDRSMHGAYESVVDLMNARDTTWGRFQLESLLAQNGDAHQRIRKVLAPAFTPQQANKHRPLMRKVIGELLDEWAPKGEFDFEDFASFFPITVMCSLIGASPKIIPDMRGAMETFGLSMGMDPEFLPQLVGATDELDAFVQDLVAERKANRKPKGEEDLLELLVTNLDEGSLSERELYDLLIFLFVAGYDTSKNALALMMSALIDRPELYEQCATDVSLCKKVVEENFRFVTTATIPRLLTRDVTYRDVLFPAGTMLFFPVSVAGRDPSAFGDPDKFDPQRDDVKKHLAFGMGVHICLGQFIARAQIEEGLHLIAQRLKNPRRTGPSGWRPFFGTWGMKGLPIAFDPAPARKLEEVA